MRRYPSRRANTNPRTSGNTRQTRAAFRILCHGRRLAYYPGQLGVGATVRHAVYGIGEVRFMRDGFPKVKVSFHGGDQKVDKSELTVVG